MKETENTQKKQGERRKPLMLMLKFTARQWDMAMGKMAREAGIPESYREILMHLHRHPGVSQKELAESRRITTAAISQTIKEMELTGYVKKEPGEGDRRYVQLYLTEKGNQCAEEVLEKIHRADEVLTKAITPQKEAEMVDFLRELQETICQKL